MKDYKVRVPVKDLGGIHQPGETVSLSDKDAAELIALGAVELIAPPAELSRQDVIVEAIGKLDKENIDLWLKDGKPDTNAIAKITGWPVTATERDAAYATYSAPAA